MRIAANLYQLVMSPRYTANKDDGDNKFVVKNMHTNQFKFQSLSIQMSDEYLARTGSKPD